MQEEIIYRPYRVFIDGQGKKYVKKKGKKYYFKKNAPIKKLKRKVNRNVNVDKSFSNYVRYLKGNIYQQQLTQSLVNRGQIGQQNMAEVVNIFHDVKKELSEDIKHQGEDILKNLTKHIDDTYIHEGPKVNKNVIESFEPINYLPEDVIEVIPIEEEYKQRHNQPEDISTIYEEPLEEEQEDLSSISLSLLPPEKVDPDKYFKDRKIFSYSDFKNKVTASMMKDLGIKEKSIKIDPFKLILKTYDRPKKKGEIVSNTIKEVIEDIFKKNPNLKGSGKWQGKKWQGLYNTEIDKMLLPIADKINYYGCVSLDELPNLLNQIKTRKFTFIYNTAKVNDGESAQHHWIAVNCDGSSFEVYNCLGDKIQPFAKKCFEDFIKNKDIYLTLKISRTKMQGDSANCGFFAIKFLVARALWHVPYDKITGFRSIKKNEENIEDLKNNYKKFGFI